MTGGQTALSLGSEDAEKDAGQQQAIMRLSAQRQPLPVIRANEEEVAQHQSLLDIIDKKSGGNCHWNGLLN
jgi:DNA polymerase-3 subunit epsilon